MPSILHPSQKIPLLGLGPLGCLDLGGRGEPMLGRQDSAPSKKDPTPQTTRETPHPPESTIPAMRGLILVGLAVFPACASPVSDIQLAPLFSRQTVPGYSTVEGVGGFLSSTRSDRGMKWSAGPLAGRETDPDGKTRMDFLWPLGRVEEDPSRPRKFSRLWPLFWSRRDTRADGVEDRDWNILLFIHGGSSSDGKEDSFAIFPIYGKLHDFLTWDEVEFHLFPLHVSAKKDGVTTRNLLFPFLSWKKGPEVSGWKVFPLVGSHAKKDSYRRTFMLWPLWHHWEEDMDKKEPRRGWFLFPLFGRIEQGDYQATTVLWPFFGWASRPSTDYKAWSFWPLLKSESGGVTPDREVTRVLPFLLRHRDATGETTSWLWPLVWRREFHYAHMEGDSMHIFPFFHKGSRRFDDGSREDLLHLWPLGIRIETPERSLLAFPSLGTSIDERLGFAYQAWRSKIDGSTLDRRFWLGLYREIEAAGHHRWSIPLLGGAWTEPDGTRHHSWLGGLLRWRTGPRGVAMETPAFPGPGWPSLAEGNEVEEE